MDYSVNQGNRVPLLRIIDANANRATEGMRVIEEYARFALDDAHLTRLQKQLRHDLIEVLQVLPREELCAARTTEQDVGTQIATQAEFERQDIRQVATANQKRVEQSLRSLEEFLKPLSAETARQIEQLRYRAYALGRAVELTGFSRQRLEQAKLYVLVDGGESLDAFSTAAAALVRSGVHVLQLRDLRLDDRQLVARGRRLRELTRETPTLFVMNNRPDLAVLTQADGVHVGQDDLSSLKVFVLCLNRQAPPVMPLLLSHRSGIPWQLHSGRKVLLFVLTKKRLASRSQGHPASKISNLTNVAAWNPGAV